LEQHAVAMLERACGVGERGMRDRAPASPPRSEPALFDEVVVAVEPTRLPLHLPAQVLEEVVRAPHPPAGDVDPRPVAEVDAFDAGVGVDADLAHRLSMPEASSLDSPRLYPHHDPMPKINVYLPDQLAAAVKEA